MFSSLWISIWFAVSVFAQDHGTAAGSGHSLDSAREYLVQNVTVEGDELRVDLKDMHGKAAKKAAHANHPHLLLMKDALSMARDAQIETEFAGFDKKGFFSAIELERGNCGGGTLTGLMRDNLRVQRLEIQAGQIEFVLADDRGRPIGKVEIERVAEGDRMFASLLEAMKKDVLVNIKSDDKGRPTSVTHTKTKFDLKNCLDRKKY